MKGGPESDGVVTYPIGYQPGKRYPLVLYIHGGPYVVFQADVDQVLAAVRRPGVDGVRAKLPRQR